MAFEQFWEEVEKIGVLPEMAIKQLPSSLSQDTKKKLIIVGAEKTANLLLEVIDVINHGSVESIDFLLSKRLE